MKPLIISGIGTALLLAASLTVADEAADLIAMDKAWGEAENAAAVESMLASDFVGVSGDGMADRAAFLADMDANPPPDGPYIAGDYRVHMLDADTAVMVHTAGEGDDAHYSLHVWQKHKGKWQVAATASVDMD